MSDIHDLCERYKKHLDKSTGKSHVAVTFGGGYIHVTCPDDPTMNHRKRTTEIRALLHGAKEFFNGRTYQAFETRT